MRVTQAFAYCRRCSNWLEMNAVLIWIYCLCSAYSWNINLQAKQNINSNSLGWSFRVESGYFKLLEIDGQWLLAGGRNFIYNLSAEELVLQKSLEWSPTKQDVDVCRMKGKSEEECQNYIRVLTKQGNGRILVCGTNAYKPLCRQYSLHEDSEYQIQREFSGFAISPYDPKHNSSAFYVQATDELYAATVSDFIGSDPLIYRKPLSGSGNELRTQRNNVNSLNDPNFVSIIDDNDAIYFFFRENALEHANCGSNSDKAIYSRVGRVCKNDRGGGRTHSDTWTSFVKARLNCSLPGPIPLYFDELQSSVKLKDSARGKEMIYAIFSTPHNGIQTSTVCAFRMDDIKRTLTKSAFKSQNTPTSLWGSADTPSPRPGLCEDDSLDLADDMIKFIQKHPLMDETVPSAFGEPLLIHNDLRSHFTQIAVHPNVPSVDGARKYDVIFVGTDDGRILKFVQINGKETVKSILIESINVFDGQSINNLLVYAPLAQEGVTKNGQERLIVTAQSEIKSLPLHNCQNKTSCGSCVRLHDPHCAWDVAGQKCVGRADGRWPDGNFKQSVEYGQSSDCVNAEIDEKILFAFNDLDPQSVSNQKTFVYGSELNMAVAVILTLTIAASVGFFIGYTFSRWKTYVLSSKYSSSTSSTSGPCYADTRRINCGRMMDIYGDGESAVVPSKFDEQEISKLMLTGEERSDYSIGKKEDVCFLTNDKVPVSKDYKVKKMYV